MQTIGRLIRERREELGLSLAALAARVACAKSYLSELENERRQRPPGRALVARLEHALDFEPGRLALVCDWHVTPPGVKRQVMELRSREDAARALLQRLKERGVDAVHGSGELRRVIEEALDPELDGANAPQDDSGFAGKALDHAQGRAASTDPGGGAPNRHAKHTRIGGPATISGGHAPWSGDDIARILPVQVPVINSVRAGHAAEYTDLAYPPGVGDDYISIPDLYDPDAFAARVVGDSMEPDYREGDLVVFSPILTPADASDCFVRFERDDESTFKRIYFQYDDDGAQLIRLQPLNSRYPPKVVPREAVAMLCAAVSLVRRVGA